MSFNINKAAIEEMLAYAGSLHDELIAIPRDLHCHPELLYVQSVITGTFRAFSKQTVAAITAGLERHAQAASLAYGGFYHFALREGIGAGRFYLLGCGNESLGIREGLHRPKFDLDESVLVQGTRLLVQLAAGASH